MSSAQLGQRIPPTVRASGCTVTASSSRPLRALPIGPAGSAPALRIGIHSKSRGADGPGGGGGGGRRGGPVAHDRRDGPRRDARRLLAGDLRQSRPPGGGGTRPERISRVCAGGRHMRRGRRPRGSPDRSRAVVYVVPAVWSGPLERQGRRRHVLCWSCRPTSLRSDLAA
ncbi:hypothetical protein PAHAL_5G418400 [Panicum hallii]|uniref:Uncharacterized protein n=1 Tax=Panicum hallii TaxID=206008 RepID=A0A2T8IMV5_9POAL|nr:hypothetical protein PAHAL_5G418400 [Panicum hallii]